MPPKPLARIHQRSASLKLALGGALIFVINLAVLFKLGKFLTAIAHPVDTINSIVVNDNGSTHSPDNSSKEVSAAMDFFWLASLRHTTLRLASPYKHQNITPTSQEYIRRELVFPDATKRVWIDVGVHMESDFIDNVNNESDLFLIGFEPSNKWKPCRIPRCVTIWAACTPTYDASVSLNIQGGDDLCNSLLKPQSNTSSALWRGCVTQEKNPDGSEYAINVPGIPLSELIHRVPSSVIVELVKIDAQGFDLEVMKGFLSVSDRVQVCALEAMDVTDPKKLLYAGQPMLSEIEEYLAPKGWKYITSVSNNGVSGEVNAFFVFDDQYTTKAMKFAEIFKWQSLHVRD